MSNTRLTGETDALDHTKSYAYDEAGDLTRSGDPAGLVWQGVNGGQAGTWRLIDY